jgi:hypothetical protein
VPEPREAPPVTVHGGRPARLDPPRPPLSRQRLGLGVLVVVGLLLGSGIVGHVRDAQVRSRQRTAALLQVSLSGQGAVPPQRGVPGALVQEAQVVVEVRNESPFAVRLLHSDLDGAERGQRAAAAPGDAMDVPLTWRIRCAEIGLQPGPHLLTLRVEGQGRQREVQLPLAPYDGHPGLARTFHLAALQACDVLVDGAR